MAVPKFLQSALWSYELSRMDAKRHASTIIPQIFNYGLWDQIRWVLKTYPQRTIKKHIKNPARGMWYEDAKEKAMKRQKAPPSHQVFIHGVAVASLKDIAAMKLIAISQRGRHSTWTSVF